MARTWIFIALGLAWGCSPQTGTKSTLAAIGEVDSAAADLLITTPANTRHALELVLGGSFKMGTFNGDLDEGPVHEVYVDSFFLDKYEVTNAHYVVFLDAVGKYTDDRGNVLLDVHDLQSPIGWDGYGFELKSTPKKRDRSNHPVTEVTWHGASEYCKWAGLRLPSEAEWERAARGDDERPYPWGDVFSGKRAHSRARFTAPVGSHAQGVSPYGVHDMAGSVLEWTQDRYASSYYSESPRDNPPGPADGLLRVIRGGSWRDNIKHLRTTARTGVGPTTSTNNLGFRCARSRSTDDAED